MRIFNDQATPVTSPQFGDSSVTQAGLTFSVEGVSDVSATIALDGLVQGEWVELLSGTAAGSLRALAGGVTNTPAQAYRLRLVQVEGSVTASVALGVAENRTLDLSAMTISVVPVDGGSFNLPNTSKEMIVTLDHPDPIDNYTINLGSAASGRNRQSLLVRTNADIGNLTIAGAPIIDNPSSMLFSAGCVIFIRLNPTIWSRVV